MPVNSRAHGHIRPCQYRHALPEWLPPSLAGAVATRAVDKGDALFHTGASVDLFHFVLRGKLAAVRSMPNGAEAIMLVARDGEFFAEASLFLPSYTCEARALTTCQIASWPVGLFRQALERHPDAAMAFARTLAISLRRQCSRVERLRLKLAPDRVLHYLACETGPSGWTELPGTVRDWAAELALEPETLYRVLAQLTRAGKVEREKNRLRLTGACGPVCAR